MENSDKAFTNWFVLMCVAHATAVFGLAMVEQLEKKPKAKQEPTRVSIQLVRAVPPPTPKPILPPSIEHYRVGTEPATDNLIHNLCDSQQRLAASEAENKLEL